MKTDLTKGGLLSRWKNRTKTVVTSNAIVKVPETTALPLTHQQKSLWFLQQLYPDNPFYNLSEYLILNGQLDIAHLTLSLKHLFDTHRIFKSYYPEVDGKPLFQIDESLAFQLEHVDFSHLPLEKARQATNTALDEAAHTAFNLNEAPLYRITLYTLSPTRHVLFFKLHHIITDQWSMQHLKTTIARQYAALIKGEALPPSSKAAINYMDFAYWQQQQNYSKALEYWKTQFAELPPQLNLPKDKVRPNLPNYKGNTISLDIPQPIAHAALDLAKTLHTTPFVLFLSAYYIMLYNFSRQDEIVVGTPVSNRSQNSLEDVFGLCIDTMALKANIDPNSTISAFITSINSLFSKALEHKELPFDVLVKALHIERTTTANPLFQAMFVYNSSGETPDFGTDLQVITPTAYTAKVSKFDLTLFVSEHQGQLTVALEYATALFNEDTITRFQDYFVETLDFIGKHQNAEIAKIPVHTAADTTLIATAPTETHEFSTYHGIHERIAQIAATTPLQTAVAFGTAHIDYTTLNTRANAVALSLMHAAPIGKIVGLCLERSIDMIVGLLGILKAGYAYLPIDPDYPKAHMEYILEDAKVDTIVTQTTFRSQFKLLNKTTVSVDQSTLSTDAIVLPEVKPNDLAYVIYTSGSTGQPKGVPISHKNIIQSTAGRLTFYEHMPKAFLLMSSIAFDSSKAGLFWTLCTGGKLVVTPKRIEQDLEQIADTIATHKITHTLMLPSLYAVILEHISPSKLQTLQTVMVAGERCSVPLCQKHFEILPQTALYNEYGPTEASVWCIAHKVSLKTLINATQIPIGTPVAQASIHLLDTNGHPVPVGVSGEIYIGGDTLSKGYLNHPELTQKAFIHPVFAPHTTLYKTGDLARYNTNGAIEFLGRKDQQIKIRGYRVEIDAITATLTKSSAIQQAVVLVKTNARGTQQLIAFLQTTAGFTMATLKAELKEKLPDYMIPSHFTIVDEIPRLPNGKIDTTTLSNLKTVQHTKPSETKVLTLTEAQLLIIWKRLLHLEDLSIHDNFFELGGDSILSIQIMAKARVEGIHIAPNQIFEHQTIAELAHYVTTESTSAVHHESLPFGATPLLPIQEWFFETHKNAPHYWNQGFHFKTLPEGATAHFVKRITQNIIKHHDALRAAFHFKHNTWQAVIQPVSEDKGFQIIDLSAVPLAEQSAHLEAQLQAIQNAITLDQGNLFQCLYIETGTPATNSFILSAHHLVIDVVSWQMLLDYYKTTLERQKLQPLTQTASVKTWGNYLLEQVNTPAIDQELAYWQQEITHQNELPLDHACPLPILEKDVNRIAFEIDSATTQQLQKEANAAYNTKTDELLLAAFTLAVSQWSKTSKIALALERHGRTSDRPEHDLSNTVGWFTAFFPKTVKVEDHSNLEQHIMQTKETLRQTPQHGIGYGILRHLSSKLGTAAYPNIVFNFLGTSSHTDTNVAFLTKHMRAPQSERHYYIEVNALIQNDKLQVDWSYAATAFQTETMQNCSAAFKAILQDIVNHCTTSTATRYTPSDFEDVDLDQDDLDALLNTLEL